MRSLAHIASVGVLAASTLAASGPTSAVPSNPDDKTILHVLNRIGFGARPGDVERVRQIGLSAYLDQQLRPERIPDPQVATRLASFDTLNKSSRQIAQEYYLPAQLARREAQRKAGAARDAHAHGGAGKQPRTPREKETAPKRRAV